jgi:hypothetical protein
MGTNYYLHYNICKCCSRSDEIHIGKSSGGWTFSFQGYRANGTYYTEIKDKDEKELKIESYKDWLSFLERMIAKGSEIRDEYNEKISLDKFKELVERKKDEKFNHTKYCMVEHPSSMKDLWLDAEGHSFSDGDFS